MTRDYCGACGDLWDSRHEQRGCPNSRPTPPTPTRSPRQRLDTPLTDDERARALTGIRAARAVLRGDALSSST